MGVIQYMNPNTPFLVIRDLESTAKSAVSTADSFKSWDTCMDNKVCKPVAIVLIVICVLIVLSIFACIVNCLCCTISCIDNLCCCCKGGSRSAKQQGFAPLPEPQYARQVEPVYVPQPAYGQNMGSYQNTAYQPSDPYAYEPKTDNRYNTTKY